MLRPDKRYEIHFSVTTAKLLKSPYRTRCYDYQSARPEGHAISADQCVNACLLKIYRERGNCLPFHRRIRLTLSNAPIKFCPDHIETELARLEKADTFCIEYCKPDCYQNYYDFEVTKTSSIVPDSV